MNNLDETSNFYIRDIEEAYNNGELYDYISENALDIDIVISLNGNYKGVEYQLGVNGPTIWIDRYGKLIVSWGGKTRETVLDSAIARELDMIGEELYSSYRVSRPGMCSPGRSMRSASRLSSRSGMARPTSSLRSATRSSDLRRQRK